jgi:hypothetical protein
MSSLRSFSQIPVRTKFLIATQTVEGGGVGGGFDDAAISFVGGYPGPTLLLGSRVANYVSMTQGDILKDMGRSVTIYNTDGSHHATYREVQRIRNATTEGVNGPLDVNDGPYGTFFVLVWAADGNNVVVVRLG